jgi:hypothetical protein
MFSGKNGLLRVMIPLYECNLRKVIWGFLCNCTYTIRHDIFSRWILVVRVLIHRWCQKASNTVPIWEIYSVQSLLTEDGKDVKIDIELTNAVLVSAV